MKKETKQKAGISILVLLATAITVGISFTGCNQQSKKKKTEKEIKEMKDEEPDNDILTIEEYEFYDIPVAVKAKAKPEKEVSAKPEKKEKAEKAEPEEDENYVIISFDDLNSNLIDRGYEPNVVKVTTAAVPLDETQTVTSYSKKGKEKDAFQVVTSSDGSVDQIVFADKRHKDVYNVQVGMTGKEVKKIRKDMKHVVKKGKVFLYNDDSNIMYLMKAEDEMGNEIDTSRIDNMQVQAIVWKDKRHRNEKK